jgi:DeoR/GlpR family transcriptional regulator of sugar metabolism
MLSTINERREKILAFAYKHGRVWVKELSDVLNVSEATVRRDLQGIAAEGLLELNHGGACVVKHSDYSFISKSMRNVEAKRVIALLAAELVRDGDQIFLDSGTTCFAMTKFLRTKKSLSIIVNSVRTAQELQAPGLNVLMLGGQYRPERMDTIGPIAYETLNRLRGYLTFLGTDGLSRDFGFTSIDIESANLFGLAVQNGRESILLADSSKFDRPALYKITDIHSISTIITEKTPSEIWRRFFNENGIKIIHPDSFDAATKTTGAY